MKTCRKCQTPKPVAEFHAERRNRDGLGSWCKECNRESSRAYSRRKYAEDPELLKGRVREYQARLTPEQRARRKKVNDAWRARNRESINARNKAYMDAHPDVREKQRQAIAEWWRAHPFKVAEKAARRRAQTKGGKVTETEWLERCARYDNRCAYCLDEVRLTMDHVTPLSRGGEHAIRNILPACQSCNSRKGTKLLSEWCPR